MAVEGVDSLYEKLKACPPEKTGEAGFANVSRAIGEYMSGIQGGPTGSSGIITFNEEIFGTLCATLPPDTSGDAFPAKMASFWLNAVLASVIRPGTVQSPTWISSGADILTAPSAAASIPTLSVAVNILETGIKKVKGDKRPPQAMAQAFHDACMALSFLCIGIGPPPALPPIPLVVSAK